MQSLYLFDKDDIYREYLFFFSLLHLDLCSHIQFRRFLDNIAEGLAHLDTLAGCQLEFKVGRCFKNKHNCRSEIKSTHLIPWSQWLSTQ